MVVQEMQKDNKPESMVGFAQRMLKDTFSQSNTCSKCGHMLSSSKTKGKYCAWCSRPKPRVIE